MSSQSEYQRTINSQKYCFQTLLNSWSTRNSSRRNLAQSKSSQSQKSSLKSSSARNSSQYSTKTAASHYSYMTPPAPRSSNRHACTTAQTDMPADGQLAIMRHAKAVVRVCSEHRGRPVCLDGAIGLLILIELLDSLVLDIQPCLTIQSSILQ